MNPRQISVPEFIKGDSSPSPLTADLRVEGCHIFLDKIAQKSDIAVLLLLVNCST